MASGNGVQVDKGGFVRIHNTILEVLAKAHLRGQQYKLILFLFRKTYGYNLKENKISLKEWAEGTNMQRQNAWRELHLLVECKVIYMKSNGEKRPATWGFNKYFEQWNLQSVITDDDKSVIADDYTANESVVTDDYSEEKSVITSDDKSVITPSHTRDLKDSKDSRAAAADFPKRNVSAFAKAYQDILGKMVESRTRSEEIQDWETRVPYPAWEYALHEALDKGHRHDWKYTIRILERLEREGFLPKVTNAASSTELDFSLEQLL